MSGLAIESATEHVEVLVCDEDGAPLVHVAEDVAHGHTRRLAPLVAGVLAEAGRPARALEWIAADLGPGSFTAIRVGLATARALALASSARLIGASSLAALAHSAGARRALLVPLLAAGKREVYAGFFRAGPRGAVRLMAAPMVAGTAAVLDQVAELAPLLPRAAVRFVGPGAAREREALERAHPGSTAPAWRDGGLSALDLMRAARSGGGPAAGLPAADGEVAPLYVRPAQAEERVRRRALEASRPALREFAAADVAAAAEIERRVFSDPWPESFFLGELRSPLAYARVAESGGRIAGYSLAWLGEGEGHLGNLAVAPGHRRRGVGRLLLEDLLARAAAQGVDALTLEVRVSNFAAQWLYRAHGFRVAGLRPRYYRDTGEDALVMSWRRSGAEG